MERPACYQIYRLSRKRLQRAMDCIIISPIPGTGDDPLLSVYRTAFCQPESLLAVDMGLRTGLALYGQDGRLIWYRSTNFGSVPRLRRGVPNLLAGLPNPTHLVLEGGGKMAKIWEREATLRYIDYWCISAETWRERLLLPRQQRNRFLAKHFATGVARAIIDWSGAPKPAVPLESDTAEAILIGLWGVLKVGWLAEPPPALRR